MAKEKKRSSKNLRISTRILITTVVGILIPIMIIASFSTLFLRTIATNFNFSSVTTDTYSTLNNLQWSQVVGNISMELVADNDNSKKLANVKTYITPLEQAGTYVYIHDDEGVFYATDDSVLGRIGAVNLDKNTYNYTDGGLTIINHVERNEHHYLLVLFNDNYKVNDASKLLTAKEFSRLLLGRTGVMITAIAVVFVLAIAIVSFITSQTIVRPIKKIAKGADEIARGNLDYEIEYNSTNELGETVESFNQMRLKLKESIEKQNSAIEERNILIAGIAHDLRTPLTSAKGYTEGLLDGIATTKEKQERYLKTIAGSINETEKILDDLLTISRLQLKSYRLNKVDVDIREFALDAGEEIKFLLEQNDFDFSLAINFAKPVILELDTDAFARVISNIIMNSLKYRRDDVKGKVTMKLSEYERTVIIELADNGIGVDRKSLPKIFDTMYRADPARTKVSDGSGLGLSVCRQIVELHGGIIWANSKEGEGLTILISLPKKDVQK